MRSTEKPPIEHRQGKKAKFFGHKKPQGRNVHLDLFCALFIYQTEKTPSSSIWQLKYLERKKMTQNIKKGRDLNIKGILKKNT